MECPNCGSTLQDDARFCSLCFTKFDDSAPALGPQPELGQAPPVSFAAQPATSPRGFPVQTSPPPVIPPEELEQIRSFSAASNGLPLVPVRDESMGRRVAIITCGSLLTLAIGYVLGYLPVPFIGYAAPFLGGVFVGYKLGYEGGKWGAIAAGIPAVLSGILVLIVGMALMPALTKEAATQAGSSKIPTSSLAGMFGGIIWFAVVVGIAVYSLMGFLGGRVGERYGRTLG